MEAITELSQAQKVVLFNPNDLPLIWPRIEPLVDKAVAWGDEWTKESLVDAVLKGFVHLIGFVDGEDILSIAVLKVSVFPSGNRKLEVLLASGEGLKDWRRFQSDVAAFGKSFGCTSFRMIGREGLARMLPDWKRTKIVLEREIA